MRPSRYHSRTREQLTERQCEVLDLIARGKTNPQIAEALGMTLDGAKFHVSEILAKLDLSSREEAAEWWRRERSVKQRGLNAVGWVFGLSRVTVAVCAGSMVAVMVLAAMFFVEPWNPHGDATPSTTSTASPAASTEPVAATQPCPLNELTFSFDAASRPGEVQLFLDASGAGPCRLTTQAGLLLFPAATIDPAVDVPRGADLQHRFILKKDFPSSGIMAVWDWINWCGPTEYPFQWQLSLMDTAGNALREPLMLDVDTFPPCRDANALNTLTLENATTGVNGSPLACPGEIPSSVCSFASNLKTMLSGADTIGRLVQTGITTTYTCAENGTTTTNEFTHICAGHPPGDTVQGFHLAMHGSEGQTLSPADFTKALQDEFGKIVPQLASIGCATISADCEDFVVAFATGKQPAAVYLAFQIQPGGRPALTGAGLSGDNAVTILTGGKTMSVIGETIFFPVLP